MSIPPIRRTLVVAPVVALTLACAGDTATTAVAPEMSAPDAPARSFTINCDPGYTVRLKKAEFGSPVSFIGLPSVAFTGITMHYTADVIKNSTQLPVAIGAVAEWSEVGQAFPRLNVGAVQVDLSSNTILNTMDGVSTGPDNIQIKVYVSDGGGDIYKGACTTLPIDVQSGSPASIDFTPPSGTKIPVDRTLDVKASLRNVAMTSLPQTGLTFTALSGPAVTITPQNDSVFHVQPTAQGAVTLRASYGGLTRDYALNVCAPSTQAETITLPGPSPVLNAGESVDVGALAYNCAGQLVGVTWQSSDPTVATVASKSADVGTVHALNPGIAYITASSGSASASVLVQVKLEAPTVYGSVVVDPSYPTGTAHLSWSSSTGATSYKIYRMCRTSDGYTPGWEEWSSTTETSWDSYDYVMSYAGTSPPDNAYMAYYVVASGPSGDSPASQTLYFNWDDVAEPGC